MDLEESLKAPEPTAPLTDEDKVPDEYSKPTLRKPIEHPDFSFTGVTKPSGLSETDVFNLISAKYGKPITGKSRFKNLNIINSPKQRWKGKFSPSTGKITLNAYFLTKEDAARVLEHEKVHEYIKKNIAFKKAVNHISTLAKRDPNSAAGKALEIAKRRVPKDSK